MSPVYCECLKIAGSLRDCPAHGMFATASRRVELEAEAERLRAECHAVTEDRDNLLVEFLSCYQLLREARGEDWLRGQDADYGLLLRQRLGGDVP